MQYIEYFGHGLHQLIYVSHSTKQLGDPDEIAGIVAQSNARNYKRALTGALLIYGQTFVQVLEGDHATLKALLATLEADPRHRDLALKGVRSIEQRMFGRWGMREGRVANGVAPADIASLGYDDLCALLRLSVKSPLRKAA